MRRKITTLKTKVSWVYIDETGIDNNMSSLYGWALRRVKSFAEILGHSTVRKTLIAGYCYGNTQLVAPMEYDGYTNTEVICYLD